MHLRWKTFQALATLTLAVEACGGSGGGAGPSTTQACMDLATARCNKRSSCTSLSASDPLGFGVARMYGDMSTCLARETLACENGLMAPQTGNNAALVERCVAAFAAFSCQDFFDNNPPADCVVTGSRGTGVPCTFNGQCSSQYCQGTKNSVCGTCLTPPSAGTDCTGSTCWHNQRCVASSMTCQEVVSLNGSCDSTHPCDNGLACVGDTSTTAGSCETAGTAVGVSCGGGSMPGCDGTMGLYCGGAAGAKTCMTIALVGSGQPCGVLADGSHVACTKGDCYTATGLAGSGEMGTCKDAADAPAACDTTLGPGCLAPARCVVSGAGTAGTCVVPVATMCSGG